MENKHQIKAIIVSLGGSIEPIIKSILHYKPEFIFFYASQKTYELTCQIRKSVEETFKYESEIVIVDNPEDLIHCSEKAEELIKRVLMKNYTNQEIIVDYTGGTKNMSVALSLASILHGFLFSYVGGSERTKGGVGIVVSGSEKIYSSVNPWDFFAKDDFIRFCDFFDRYQFSSAVSVIDNILNKTTKYKAVFEVMHQIVDAYKLWDLFRHKESYRVFNKINLKYLRDFEKYNFNKVIDIIEKNIKFVEALHDLKSVSILHIYDLISNADRRYEEGKIDDAILRLYRAVEMIAQLSLSENYNIDSSKVKISQIPEKIRDEFQKKYSDADSENLKLPLFASFVLLKELGNEIGKKFFENQDEFKKVLSLRNNSYLAHGYQSSKEDVYTKFRVIIISLFKEFSEDDLPKFPKLSKVI